MNRCISITKNNKKCRAKINNNSLFCCTDHEPINKELIDEGCFLCMEKIEKTNEILFLKCRHAFHKPCYLEWLNFSTYEEPICIICRNIAFKKKDCKKENNIVKNYVDDKSLIDNIFLTLKIKKKCLCCFGVDSYVKMYEPKSPDYPPPIIM